jgi:hypothetical protein
MSGEVGGITDLQGGLRGEGRAGEKHPLWMGEESGRSDGLSLENLVTVVLEECGLLGVERAYVQGQFNAPLQQGLLNAVFGTQ